MPCKSTCKSLSLASSASVALALLGLSCLPDRISAQPLAFVDPADQAAPFASDGEAEAADPGVADDSAEIDARLRRQVVAYDGPEAPGTVIVDTRHTYLYLVQPGHTAIRYGIGVGREGFTWSGTQTIARKAEWPDWYPPSQMVKRQPYLPRFVAGGPGNPLGARALYLGNTEYRIHGTNDPATIGKRVSSGCIRLTNSDIADLYSRVGVGTRVVVLPASDRARPAVAAGRRAPARASSDAPRPAHLSAANGRRIDVASNEAGAAGAVASGLHRAPQPFGLY